MQTTKAQMERLDVLRARADFLLVQNSGKKWVSPSLILQVRENDVGLTRVGFTVSKKVHKSAVKRNRIKRRLRAVAADILSGHAKAGCDYVLVGRDVTADKSYDALLKDMTWCMKRTGFYESAAPDA